MSSAPDMSRLIPGFEFMQNLMKGGGGLSAMAPWVTPTLDPAELDKRISDLRTVQFWLEQNARLLATTIQAMEVQRMTLTTLQKLNLSMNDMRKAFEIPATAAVKAAAPAGTSFASPFAFAAGPSESPNREAPAAATAAPAYFARPTPPSGELRSTEAGVPPASDEAAPTPGSGTSAAVRGGEPASAETAPATPLVDPMEWWGAVARQFTDIARQAMANTTAAASAATAATSAVGTAAAAAVANAAEKVGTRAQPKAVKKAVPARARADASPVSTPSAKSASTRRAEPAAKAARRHKA